MKKSVFFIVFTVALGLFTVDWLFAETTVTEVASTTEAAIPLNYVTFRGGPGWANEANRTAGMYESDQKFKSEYMLNLAYGRRLCDWFRLEAEIGYTHMSVDNLKNKNSGSEVDISGNDSHISGLINAYFDIKNSTDFTPFVGVGVGVAHTKLDTEFIGPVHGVKVKTNDSDTAFAYQFLAGVSWAFHPSWSIDLMYKFYGTNERDHTNSAGNAVSVNVEGTKASFVELGLRYCF